MVSLNANKQKHPGKALYAVYLRDTGYYLGTFVARSEVAAVMMAVDYHGNGQIRELACIGALPMAAFEVVLSISEW